jgi:uncharacterized protein YndB with AHSA1/START domain
MSVKKDATGRRSVQVEVEVPGTPEEVWQAIATGPGVSSWFVPTEVEEREGGALTAHFGPGMDSLATVTAWEPPHRFAAESRGLGPGAPPLATEWTVEARSGGACVVRVVHSLFASTDDWDDQLESVESGWPAFFRILRLYLTHFRGERCSRFQMIGFAPGPESKAWDALTGSLGLGAAAVGQRRSTGAGAPPLTGVVEAMREGKHPYALLLLDEPAPGAAFLNVCGMGSQVFMAISFYLYGDGAAAAVAHDEPLWHAWMTNSFPATGDASSVA